MKFSTSLRPISDAIYNLLSENTLLEIPDYGWENYVWTSKNFRWAHLENYCSPKASVLHCVIMPHTDRNAPIYGFDVIELNGNITGMFLDITPVNDQEYFLPRVGTPRDRPAWADFFSTYFVCSRPESLDDVWQGVDILKSYLHLLPGGQDGDYRKAQRKYTQGQKQNPQTYRMLKSHIGSEQAWEFMENVLFPDP